jgi:lysophospholipase L1-like esterase
MPMLRLIICLLMAISCAYGDTSYDNWEPDIRRFEYLDSINPPPDNSVLFVGSSSIVKWTTLAQDLNEFNPINRGFGGSEIDDTLHFVDRIVIPYHPKIIVMYAGGNDISAGKTPERVAADFESFVQKVWSALPDTRILFISIAPNPRRFAQIDKIRRANHMIRHYCHTDPKLSFLDVFGPMYPHVKKADIFAPDGLHMNSAGYKLWTPLVRQHLVRLSAGTDLSVN